MKSNKGQALVENIFIIPVLVLIIFSIFWFARILITKQMLVTAARYGTDMILYTNLNEVQIRQEIRNYLSSSQIRGRILDPEKLNDDNIRIKIERFQIGSLPDFNSIEGLLAIPQIVSKLENLSDGILNPMSHTSCVEIYYDFEVPVFMRLSNSRNKITVSARSEVLAGTGI